MSNNRNYYNNDNSFIKAVIAIVTALILFAGFTVLGFAWGTNWTMKRPEKEKEQQEQEENDDTDDTEDEGGVIVDENTSENVAVAMSAINVEDWDEYDIPETADSAYLVTVTPDPVDAVDTYTWDITGNTDNAISIAVQEDTKSAVIICNEDFDIVKTVTVKSNINEDINASLTVNYVQKIKDISLDFVAIVPDDIYSPSGNFGMQILNIDGFNTETGELYNNGEITNYYSDFEDGQVMLTSKFILSKGTVLIDTPETMTFGMEFTDEAKELINQCLSYIEIYNYVFDTYVISSFISPFPFVGQYLSNKDYLAGFDMMYLRELTNDPYYVEYSTCLYNLQSLYNDNKPCITLYTEYNGVRYSEKSVYINWNTVTANGITLSDGNINFKNISTKNK